MPYIQVDLDAKKRWPAIARGLNRPVADVALAFLELWEPLWFGAHADSTTMLQLECLFGAPGDRVAHILTEYGFLEARPGGTFRIRGAGRYSVSRDARSKGGRAAAARGNLKRGMSQPTCRTSPAQAGDSAGTSAGAQLGVTSSSIPALEPRTENQSKRRKDLAGKQPADPAYRPFVERLFAEFEQQRGSRPLPIEADWKALKALRKRVKNDAEIERRWAVGLRSEFKQRVDTWRDLNSRWDALAGTGPPGKQSTNELFEPYESEEVPRAAG